MTKRTVFITDPALNKGVVIPHAPPPALISDLVDVEDNTRQTGTGLVFHNNSYVSRTFPFQGVGNQLPSSNNQTFTVTITAQALLEQADEGTINLRLGSNVIASFQNVTIPSGTQVPIHITGQASYSSNTAVNISFQTSNATLNENSILFTWVVT